MIERAKLNIKGALRKVGLEIRPITKIPEASAADLKLIELVRPYTMTSVECLWSTLISVRYAIRNGIPGPFVECGVWRGGQAALAAHVMIAEGDLRDIWLFDTFAGMTAPTAADVNVFGESALATFKQSEEGRSNNWAFASLEDVQTTMRRTDYPDDRLHYVRGPVEATLREHPLPDRIAVLRLDTDWYESTRDEMEILFPRLCSGGVLMIDDYGHYAGARKAVDEYFTSINIFPLLQPIDYSGRIYVRP